MMNKREIGIDSLYFYNYITYIFELCHLNLHQLKMHQFYHVNFD